MFYIAVARFISKSALLSSTKDFTTYVLVKTSQSSKKWEGTGLKRQDTAHMLSWAFSYHQQLILTSSFLPGCLKAVKIYLLWVQNGSRHHVPCNPSHKNSSTLACSQKAAKKTHIHRLSWTHQEYRDRLPLIYLFIYFTSSTLASNFEFKVFPILCVLLISNTILTQ